MSREVAPSGPRMPLPYTWEQSSQLFSRVMFLVDQAATDKPKYLTLKEASAYMGLSRNFLRRLIKLGVLQALRDGPSKVRRADLDSLPDVSELSRLVKGEAAGGAVE